MKWMALVFFLFLNPLFAGTEGIDPPELSWKDVVCAHITKKFISKDGREWQFRFHQLNTKLPETSENYKYHVQLVSKGIEKYDPKTTLFTAYDIWRETHDGQWETMYHLAFYLLTPAVDQKET